MREYFMTSDRTGFSVWTENDGELAHLLWGDPEVSRYICASGVFSDAEIHDRLMLEIKRGKELGVQYWPIFTLDTDELIGCCGLRPYGEEKGVYEIGFHLRASFWRKGLAFEGAKRVIEYAFRELSAKELHAGHNPRNIPSQRLLLKLGFSYTGDEFYAPTGLMHPSYILENR